MTENLVMKQPERTVREGRAEELQPQNIGRMTLYTFKDVLNYAYTKGLIRFGKPVVEVTQTLDKNGNPQSTAVVQIAAIFLEEGPLEYPEKGQEQETHIREVECWGVGDANFENTGNANIGQHFIRMAETRAKGRALAHALNLDANFVEEMGADSSDAPAPARKASGTTASTTSGTKKQTGYTQVTENDYPPMNVEGGWACEETGEMVSGKNAYWSVRKYGKILSWDEQQKLKAISG